MYKKLNNTMYLTNINVHYNISILKFILIWVQDEYFCSIQQYTIGTNRFFFYMCNYIQNTYQIDSSSYKYV